MEMIDVAEQAITTQKEVKMLCSQFLTFSPKREVVFHHRGLEKQQGKL